MVDSAELDESFDKFASDRFSKNVRPDGAELQSSRTEYARLADWILLDNN